MLDIHMDDSHCNLQYEITGNFLGTVITSYTTETGGIANNQVVSLPWRKEINYIHNPQAAIISICGDSGLAGQTLKVIIKREGIQVGNPIEVIANNAGRFIETYQTVLFF